VANLILVGVEAKPVGGSFDEQAASAFVTAVNPPGRLDPIVDPFKVGDGPAGTSDTIRKSISGERAVVGVGEAAGVDECFHEKAGHRDFAYTNGGDGDIEGGFDCLSTTDDLLDPIASARSGMEPMEKKRHSRGLVTIAHGLGNFGLNGVDFGGLDGLELLV